MRFATFRTCGVLVAVRHLALSASCLRMTFSVGGWFFCWWCVACATFVPPVGHLRRFDGFCRLWRLRSCVAPAAISVNRANRTRWSGALLVGTRSQAVPAPSRAVRTLPCSFVQFVHLLGFVCFVRIDPLARRRAFSSHIGGAPFHSSEIRRKQEKWL